MRYSIQCEARRSLMLRKDVSSRFSVTAAKYNTVAVHTAGAESIIQRDYVERDSNEL